MSKFKKENIILLLSFKKYLIGFIIGLFFVGFIGYASGNSGTIGKLFEFLASGSENGKTVSNVYRLHGENIKDRTITRNELSYDINSFLDKISNHESRIAYLEGQIASLRGSINNNYSRINNFNYSISYNSSRINNLQYQINNLPAPTPTPNPTPTSSYRYEVITKNNSYTTYGHTDREGNTQRITHVRYELKLKKKVYIGGEFVREETLQNLVFPKNYYGGGLLKGPGCHNYNFILHRYYDCLTKGKSERDQKAQQLKRQYNAVIINN